MWVYKWDATAVMADVHFRLQPTFLCRAHPYLRLWQLASHNLFKSVNSLPLLVLFFSKAITMTFFSLFLLILVLFIFFFIVVEIVSYINAVSHC